MDTKKPAPTGVGNGTNFQSADTRNLVPPPQDFNHKTGPRRLAEIMTPAWWRSVLPEDVAEDLRFARQVERLHKLGPAPLFYMLTECGRQRGLMTFIETLVDRYADLDPDTVKSLGGDQFVQHLAGIDGGKK